MNTIKTSINHGGYRRALPNFRTRTRIYPEQIDAIVAKAVDKALAERQAKMDAAVAKSGRGDRAAKRGAIPGYGDPVRH